MFVLSHTLFTNYTLFDFESSEYTVSKKNNEFSLEPFIPY